MHKPWWADLLFWGFVLGAAAFLCYIVWYFASLFIAIVKMLGGGR